MSIEDRIANLERRLLQVELSLRAHPYDPPIPHCAWDRMPPPAGPWPPGWQPPQPCCETSFSDLPPAVAEACVDPAFIIDFRD